MSPNYEHVGSIGRRVRIQIRLSEAERATIEDYRVAKHLPNLSEAIRQLLTTGMSA